MILLRECNILKVISTHDVDWPLSGPGIDHILARKERKTGNNLNKILKQLLKTGLNIGGEEFDR